MDKKHAKGVFAEQLMAQKYRLERYTEDELIKLYTALNLVQDKIVRGWGKTIKTEYSQTQALAMLEEARKIMADIKPKIEGSIAGTLGKVSEESASVYSDMITFGGAARAAEVALLSAQQMESFWRYTPVGGQLLNEWVTKTFDGPTVDRIQREIFAGMFQGEGYREMSKRLQEGFVISKREADTLVRTYVHTANVHAMEEVYKKNRDVIAGVSWLTAFDKRTCMRCAALSGKLFPLDDHPPCPLHPRCRCVLVPETDIRKLKVKPKVADDWAKGLRDKRPPGLDTVLTPDGIPKTDFRRWILDQPEKDQLAFFGPTRYGLLKDGKIGWDDLFEETRFGGKENVRLRKLTELLGDRVVAHRAGKGYNVAVEQLALARAEREALDLARHEAMAAKLDEKALEKQARRARLEQVAKASEAKVKGASEKAAAVLKAKQEAEIIKQFLKEIEDGKFRGALIKDRISVELYGRGVKTSKKAERVAKSIVERLKRKAGKKVGTKVGTKVTAPVPKPTTKPTTKAVQKPVAPKPVQKPVVNSERALKAKRDAEAIKRVLKDVKDGKISFEYGYSDIAVSLSRMGVEGKKAEKVAIEIYTKNKNKVVVKAAAPVKAAAKPVASKPVVDAAKSSVVRTEVSQGIRDALGEISSLVDDMDSGKKSFESIKKRAEKAIKKLVESSGLLGKGYKLEGVAFEEIVLERLGRGATMAVGVRDGARKIIHINTNQVLGDNPGINLARSLMRVLHKINNKVDLLYNDEKFLASLFHEIQHTRQVFAGAITNKESDVFLELLNEWTSRRNYVHFLDRLGVKAKYAGQLQRMSPSYYLRVQNFDTLLRELGIDLDEINVQLTKINETIRVDSLIDSVADSLANNAEIGINDVDVNDKIELKKVIVKALSNSNAGNFLGGIIWKSKGS